MALQSKKPMKNYLPEALAIDQSKPSDFWRKRIKIKRRNLLYPTES
jgi:hypothetical protein